MTLSERGSVLARVSKLYMLVFTQGSLVGYPSLLWQCTSTALNPHLPELLPWPYAWSFFFFFKQAFRCSLMLLVPGNSYTSLPKVELGGSMIS